MTPSHASCMTVAGSQRAEAEPDTNPTESSPAVRGSVAAKVLPASGLRNHATISEPTAMAAVSDAASATSGSRAVPRPPLPDDAASDSAPMPASARSTMTSGRAGTRECPMCGGYSHRAMPGYNRSATGRTAAARAPLAYGDSPGSRLDLQRSRHDGCRGRTPRRSNAAHRAHPEPRGARGDRRGRAAVHLRRPRIRRADRGTRGLVPDVDGVHDRVDVRARTHLGRAWRA